MSGIAWTNSSLVGQIYCTFPMWKPMIVCNNVPTLTNGWSISNLYIMLCTQEEQIKLVATVAEERETNSHGEDVHLWLLNHFMSRPNNFTTKLCQQYPTAFNNQNQDWSLARYQKKFIMFIYSVIHLMNIIEQTIENYWQIRLKGIPNPLTIRTAIYRLDDQLKLLLHILSPNALIPRPCEAIC